MRMRVLVVVMTCVLSVVDRPVRSVERSMGGADKGLVRRRLGRRRETDYRRLLTRYPTGAPARLGAGRRIVRQGICAEGS